MTALEETLVSLGARLNKIEEESEILSKVNASNSEAITLISGAIEKIKLNDNSEVAKKIKEAESVTNKSSEELQKLPKLTAEREEIKIQQQQQQMQLEGYRNTQQKQQEQQQMQQQAW